MKRRTHPDAASGPQPSRLREKGMSCSCERRAESETTDGEEERSDADAASASADFIRAAGARGGVAEAAALGVGLSAVAGVELEVGELSRPIDVERHGKFLPTASRQFSYTRRT